MQFRAFFTSCSRIYSPAFSLPFDWITTENSHFPGRNEMHKSLPTSWTEPIKHSFKDKQYPDRAALWNNALPYFIGLSLTPWHFRSSKIAALLLHVDPWWYKIRSTSKEALPATCTKFSDASSFLSHCCRCQNRNRWSKSLRGIQKKWRWKTRCGGRQNTEWSHDFCNSFLIYNIIADFYIDRIK